MAIDSPKGNAPMVQQEVVRLHERIDQLDSKWDKRWSELSASVNAANQTLVQEAALCRACRPIVMGNGGVSLDKRVNTLETVRATSSKLYTIVVVTCASLVTGLIVAGVSHVCK